VHVPMRGLCLCACAYARIVSVYMRCYVCARVYVSASHREGDADTTLNLWDLKGHVVERTTTPAAITWYGLSCACVSLSLSLSLSVHVCMCVSFSLSF
jgi:hypothetical protein